MGERNSHLSTQNGSREFRANTIIVVWIVKDFSAIQQLQKLVAACQINSRDYYKNKAPQLRSLVYGWVSKYREMKFPTQY